jgi:hypothetical protein
MFNTEQKLEALEWFFEYVGSTTNATIEGAIEYLSNRNLNDHRIELVKLWEYQNHPTKWEY